MEPVAAESLTELVSYEMPQPRAACKFVPPEGAAQLIDLLKNEAKII